MVSHFAKALVAAVFLVLRLGYLQLLRVMGLSRPWRFDALMYHSVKAEEVRGFLGQMDMLSRSGRVVGAEFSETEAQPGQHYVAVTFDDGYRSFCDTVLPILREYAIPATIFVPTRYLGGLPGWISDPTHRDANEHLLSTEELRALISEGLVCVGSHTVNHVALGGAMLDDNEVWFELNESKKQLEETLGRNIDLFAFPYGAFDRRSVQLAGKAGYRRVFLSVPLGTMRNVDDLTMGRVDVSPSDSRFVFWLKLQGAYQYLPYAIAVKRKIQKWIRGSPGGEPGQAHETSSS